MKVFNKVLISDNIEPILKITHDKYYKITMYTIFDMTFIVYQIKYLLHHFLL